MQEERPSPVTRQSSPAFAWPVRVYHEDTDGTGVVYYANYLRFLERARTEWLRLLGFEQTELAARYKIVFVVRSLAIEYLKPAAFNDELAVTVEPERLMAGQLLLAQCVTRGGVELATARVKIVCVNTASFRPVRIPGSLSEALGRQRWSKTG
jgi:acyl-CoA thioester hydrolase